MCRSRNSRPDFPEEPEYIIELKGDFCYQSNHRDEGEAEFLGRNRELARFTDMLADTGAHGAAYLVAGYRGVGKTRFVNHALTQFQRARNKLLPLIRVNINLGNEAQMDSTTVLAHMVSFLRDKISDETPGDPDRTFQFLRFSLLASLALLITIVALSGPFGMEGSETAAESMVFLSRNNLVVLPLSIIVFALIFLNTTTFLFYYYNKLYGLRRDLDRIVVQINSVDEVKSGFFAKIVEFSKVSRTGPLSAAEIESKLSAVLAKAVGACEIIYVFDELDKLAIRTDDIAERSDGILEASKRRKWKVDKLLGELKSLITSSNATYIVIAGRDMYDSYLGESGSANSLYESLFSGYVYIPSLLTDRSDNNVYLLDSMIETYVVNNIVPTDERTEFPKLEHLNRLMRDGKFSLVGDTHKKREIDRANKIFLLKTLIHYLALHSWGNWKRMITLFESFVTREAIKVHATDADEPSYPSNERPRATQRVLKFSTRRIQKLVLASQLYILFHHNLSRFLMNADDKLVISSFSAFHHILKYHSIGFSRAHINRMYEAISVHRSPELAKVVDIILGDVLTNYVRRIRNSFHRYRFSSLHDKEIHYITTIDDHDSAVFSFSLDAMNDVKQYYMRLISVDADIGRAINDPEIRRILGNYYTWEQANDEAMLQYSFARKALESELYRQRRKSWGVEPDSSLPLLQLVELGLRQGSVAENSGNFSRAAALYEIAEAHSISIRRSGLWQHPADSKLHTLEQPTWARAYLSLKRSAAHFSTDEWMEKFRKQLASTRGGDEGLLDIDLYRLGVLQQYLERHELACKNFASIVTRGPSGDELSERHGYLHGSAYLRAGLGLLVAWGNRLFRILKKSDEKEAHQPHVATTFVIFEETLGAMVSLTQAVLSTQSFSELQKKYLGEGPGGANELKRHMEEAFGYLNSDIPGSYSATIFDSKSRKLATPNVIELATALMSKGADLFEDSRLYSYAAQAHISVLFMWIVALEMVPWREVSRLAVEIYEKHDRGVQLSPREKTLRATFKWIEARLSHDLRIGKSNWATDACTNAYMCSAASVKKAFSHSMKTLMSRNLGEKLANTIMAELEVDPVGAILRGKFRELYCNQHFSLAGQMIVAGIRWASTAVEGFADSVNGQKQLRKKQEPCGTYVTYCNTTLPFGVRYYAISLWLDGRAELNELKTMDWNKREYEEGELYYRAVRATVLLFRASQYVAKIAGDSATMVLPPIFLIYFNSWEVIWHVVDQYPLINPDAHRDLNRASLEVRQELHTVLTKQDKPIKDVSSRVLDLTYLAQETKDKLRAVELMGDVNAKSRTSIMRQMSYLDDDYEDLMFGLDWCFSRTFAAGAFAHRRTIDVEMERLRRKYETRAGAMK